MTTSRRARILSADVVSNVALCREHFRLTVRVSDFPEALPGQFVHLCPAAEPPRDYAVWEIPSDEAAWRGGSKEWRQRLVEPMLRRAFSIAGLRRLPAADPGRGSVPRTPNPDARCDLDVIYRVVGTATSWMATLRAGDQLSVLGPLGNAFPIRRDKRHAWMIAGGVGLPPMLWLGEALHRAGRAAVAFCGARSADLMALTLTGDSPAPDARSAKLCAAEFNASNLPVVLATDDGSLGFHGHVGAALCAYYEANPIPVSDLVFYTCGPEGMMRFVAEHALARGIECHVCMERSMACGMGTCQSCVLPVVEPSDVAGWRYSLCCNEGPVYAAADLLWVVPAVGGSVRSGPGCISMGP